MTIPSGVVKNVIKNKKKIKIPKIVASLSCSAGRTHFAWTKISLPNEYLKKLSILINPEHINEIRNGPEDVCPSQQENVTDWQAQTSFSSYVKEN